MKDNLRFTPSVVGSRSGETLSMIAVFVPNLVRKETGIVNTRDSSCTFCEVPLIITVAFVTVTLTVSYCPMGRLPSATVSVTFADVRSTTVDLLDMDCQADEPLMSVLCALISPIVRYRCSA